MQFPAIASIIRIDPNHSVLVWWKGEARRDLLTFDDPGFSLMYKSLGGDQGVPGDTVHWNIKRYLEALLSEVKYDFDTRGPLHLTGEGVKQILHLA